MLEILFHRYTLSPPHLELIPIHFIDLASPLFHDIPYLMNFDSTTSNLASIGFYSFDRGPSHTIGSTIPREVSSWNASFSQVLLNISLLVGWYSFFLGI
jgi:hypothetical protein